MKRRSNTILSIDNGVASILNQTQNVIFKISVQDLWILDICTWYLSDNYIAGYYNKKYRRLHQVLIGDVPKGFVIDHIDRDTLNNTRENLRIISHRENVLNSNRVSRNKFYGVSWSNTRSIYKATVGFSGKQVTIFQSKDEELCALAYDNWMLRNRPNETNSFKENLYDISRFNVSNPLEYKFKGKYFV